MAAVPRERLDEYYPVERPTFVTFVAFGEKPYYPHALVPRFRVALGEGVGGRRRRMVVLG